VPTECPTDPFWGTFVRRFEPRPNSGQIFGCWYSGQRVPLLEISVYDRALAAPPGAHTVQIDGADGAWAVAQPASRLPGTLLVVNDQSFKANFEGTEEEAFDAAERTLHLK
jgi:hypothetical protein